MLKRTGLKVLEPIFISAKPDLDWIAAYFAVFDVGLGGDHGFEDHGNSLPTVGAGELMFGRVHGSFLNVN
ncbi:MAG: hypothetical protein ACI80V_001977 [Rhodothermales bacterium]